MAKSVGPSAAKLTFRGLTAGLGLALTVVDVVLLVRDWNRVHPTVEVVDHLIQDLEKDLELIRRINTFITCAYSSDTIDEQLINEIIVAIDGSSESDVCSQEIDPKEIEITFDNRVSYHKREDL